MVLYIAFIFIAISTSGCFASQERIGLPAYVSPTISTGETSGVCPSDEMLNAQRNATKVAIKQLLLDTVTPILDQRDPCPCSGPGQWTRIAYLNMSDPSQQCPSNWNLITTPVRGCGRLTASCNSAFFPSNGQSYSHVCGRVNAYQKGSPDAFQPSVAPTIDNPFRVNSGLENVYVDGVSLTHGVAGSRQHIWTFVAALYENDPNFGLAYVCPCTNSMVQWPYQVPTFVGNNYFCATGNPGPGWVLSQVYSDDPLWDGEGCGPTNTCCQFNNPPWFCATLPQPTTDDIELRICQNNIVSNEDAIVSLVDIHIQ